jgi:hypothetical protein
VKITKVEAGNQEHFIVVNGERGEQRVYRIASSAKKLTAQLNAVQPIERDEVLKQSARTQNA